MKSDDLSSQADVKYGSVALQLCDYVDTTNFVLIGGRGVAKSTVIIARRSLRCVRLMPGAPITIAANTYANLVNNIMPAVQNGWRIDGLIEGVHYVKNVRPPQEWSRRCSVIVDDYKNTYSFWNGSVIFLGSLDNPSLLAGKSVVHLLFDEAKYAADVKASRALPILRGDAIRYGHCHLYGGVTITTDMPDITEGEHDWFFRYAAQMDPERIVHIIQAAAELNNLYRKVLMVSRTLPLDEGKLDRLERKVGYYTAALSKMRRGQTFFTNLSSFANIEILTLDYARRLRDGALELHEFQKSVMGMRPGLRRDARFYVQFGEQHKYTNGTLSGEEAFSSAELTYLDPTQPLEGGMDFGNMISLVIAQQDADIYRIHKNLYVLTPEWYPDLGARFREFFAPHACKVLNLYFDRAGNSYERQGDDAAAKIKDAIEKDPSGTRTGWTVNLLSRGQANIPQNAEYEFMVEFMRGSNPALPRLMVDAVNCSELVSSIELARARVRYKGDKKLVAKVKTSEKMALAKLPRLSTNFSDAFKYLLMRGEWRKTLRSKASTSTAASAMVDGWLDSHLPGA